MYCQRKGECTVFGLSESVSKFFLQIRDSIMFQHTINYLMHMAELGTEFHSWLFTIFDKIGMRFYDEIKSKPFALNGELLLF